MIEPDAFEHTASRWPLVPIGAVCGLNPTRDRSLIVADEGKVTFVPMPAVDADSGTIANPQVRRFGEVRKGYTFFREGDVLFAKITPCMQNGKHAVACGLLGGFGFGSTEFHVLRPNESVLAGWVHHFVRQPSLLRRFEEQLTGAVGQQGLPEETLARTEIPLPPLLEQRRIVAQLDAQLAAAARARAAIDRRTQLAAKLWHSALAAAFDPLMSAGKLWSIGEVARVQSGYAFKSEWFSSAGIRLLRNANISQGRVEWADVVRLPDDMRTDFSDYELNLGDIVITMDRPLVNGGLKISRLSSEDVPALLLQRVGRLRLTSKVSPEYLYHFLNSRFFISKISGHDYSLGVPHISPAQIEAVQLPVPSLDVQQEIADRLNRIRALAHRHVTAVADQAAALASLPAALLRQAFQNAA